MSVATLLNAVSANTTGPLVGLGTPYGNLTVSVTVTGTVSAFSVQVSGSLDGFNFEAIGSAVTSATAGTSIGSGVLFRYFQATLSGYSGAGTITAELAYSLESAASGGGGPPSGGGTLTEYIAPAVVALTDGSSIAVNAALGNVFTVTIAGNRTLASPANPVDGEVIVFRITQDATGGRTLAFGTAYSFEGALQQPVLSNTPGVTDFLAFAYSAATSQWTLVSTLIHDFGGVMGDSGESQWELKSRPAGGGITYPVPSFRPIQPNSTIAVDIMPSGSATDANYGFCWLDLCDTDIINTSGGSCGFLHLSVHASTVELGARQFGSGTAKAVILTVNNGTVCAEIDTSTNVFLGQQAALATSAANGFVSVPSMPGAPAGTPTLAAGLVPVVLDTTDKKLWAYMNSAWVALGAQVISGQYLCTPSQYAPAAQVIPATTSGTFAAVSGAASTVAAGSNGGEISTIASWGGTYGGNGVLDVASGTVFPAAGGTVSVAASGSTTAVVTYTGVSGNTLTGCAYVSGSATGTVAAGGAVTLTSAVASTGSFAAPASGDVVVTASLTFQVSGTSTDVGFGLCAHGTVTPMVGYTPVGRIGTGSEPQFQPLEWLVTGLTPGSSYNYDLMFAAASGTLDVIAQAQASTAPTLSSGGWGSPIVMKVQAV